MQKLEIKSFGPVGNIVMDVEDILILNGVQSSGKSTIAKTVYMFKNLPNAIFQYFVSNNFSENEYEKSLIIAFRLQMVSIFGTTKHMEDFYIKYNFTEDKFIEVKKDYYSGHAYVKFSDELKKSIKTVLQKYNDMKSFESNPDLIIDFSTVQLSRMELLSKLKKDITLVFEERHEPIFIPAGRSLVSTLSGELRDIESYNFDALMKDFVQRIYFMRDIFSKDLNDILEDRKRLSNAPINFEKVKKAQELISDILRGRYIYENGDEKLVLDDDHFVKLKFSSSGQQEVLWILNILYIKILENRDTFVVFEEPEAHLYPKTQYEIIKLLGLFLSNSSNQGIVTTHSPYIMSALNNLIFASIVGRKIKKASTVIAKEYWIDTVRIAAYFVENGQIHNMIDSETEIIDTSYIDSASEILNDDFERLLELMNG